MDRQAPTDSFDTRHVRDSVARLIASTARVTDPNWVGVFHLRGRRREDINRYLPDPVDA